MKTIIAVKRFIFERFYGAFAWVLFCAIFDSTWMLIDAYIPFEVWGMKYVEDFFLISAAVAVVGAIGYSFWTGHIGRAFGQIFLSFVVVIALFIAMLCVGAYTSPIAMKNRGPDKGWWSVGPNRAIPFSVEYRSAHGFLAEYERRITFSSGRHVNLQTDTGGAGAFAVYAFGEDRFYLIDGFENVSIRSVYLIDVSQELVTSCHEEYERIGRSLFGECRFLGWIHPSGKFEESVPRIDILPLGERCPDRKIMGYIDSTN